MRVTAGNQQLHVVNRGKERKTSVIGSGLDFDTQMLDAVLTIVDLRNIGKWALHHPSILQLPGCQIGMFEDILPDFVAAISRLGQRARRLYRQGEQCLTTGMEHRHGGGAEAFGQLRQNAFCAAIGHGGIGRRTFEDGHDILVRVEAAIGIDRAEWVTAPVFGDTGRIFLRPAQRVHIVYRRIRAANIPGDQADGATDGTICAARATKGTVGGVEVQLVNDRAADDNLGRAGICRAQGTVQIEFRLQHADGSERWIEQLCFPVQGNDGELLGIRGSNRDVTRRRQTEEELRNHRENLERLVEERTSELQRTNEALQREVVERRLVREALQATDEQLAAIIEFLPDATLVVDCQKRIIAWNRAIEEMTGVKKEQIIGKGDHAYSIPFYGSPQPMLIDLLMGGGREVAARYEAVTVKGNTVFGEEWVSMTGDGREACLWVTASLLFDRRGELLGAIQAIRDVTERSRAQDALLNSEKQLRALSSQLLTAQEEERKRIAQELHDSIGQSLAALKFNVENVRLALLRGAQVSALDTLAELVPKIQQVMEEARRIYMGLRPSMLDDLGIIATIGWCCREFQTTCPETRIETHLEVTEEDVAEALKIVIFRIIQEALNNVFKHSRAKHAVLTLTRTRTRLELAIQDDGSGFDHDVMARNGDPGRGMGIRGMKERAETSGGLFELTSNPGKGTTVKASWPLEAGC